LRTQAARFAPADLLKALEALTAAEQETKRSNQHRLILEMALLRLMRLPSQAAPPQPVSLPPVLVTAPVLTAPAQAAPPVLTPEPALFAEPVLAVEEITVEETALEETALEETALEDAAVPYAMPPPLAEAELSDLADDEDDSTTYALLPGDEDLDLLPSAIVVSAEDESRQDDDAPFDDLLQVQQVAFEAPPPVPVKPAPSADAPPELLRLQKSWQEVLNLIGSRSPAGVQDVKAAKPVAIQDNAVILEFDNQFSFDRVQSKEKGRKMIEEIIDRTLGAEPGTYKVKCVMAGQTLPARGSPGRSADLRAAQTLAPAHPMAAAVAADVPSPFVDEVIAVFGGRLLDDDEVTMKS